MVELGVYPNYLFTNSPPCGWPTAIFTFAGLIWVVVRGICCGMRSRGTPVSCLMMSHLGGPLSEGADLITWEGGGFYWQCGNLACGSSEELPK